MREDNNILQNLKPYKNEKSTLKEQDIEKDHKNLIDKNLNTRSLIPENGLLPSELSLFLKKVRFSEQKFSNNKSISNIKYYYLGFQNNNFFHPFNNWLNYALATYFAKFETIKGYINRFLSNLLMIPLIKKLLY